MAKKPVLLIHGGAGSRTKDKKLNLEIELSLQTILAQVYPHLKKGLPSVEAVAMAVELLENDPLYNAGRGSKIQNDGKIRMSASLMDGALLRFGGCVNIERVKNPIRLAELLLHSKDRVLAGAGAERFAREHHLPIANQYTEKNRQEFKKHKQGKTGTVGAVALDRKGALSAATSTGGRGFEYPFRVSDSPTVAGNFANRHCAISATGIGEQIVEFGVAAGLCTLVEEGLPLQKVASRLLNRAARAKAEFGFIGIDRTGHTFAKTTTELLIWGELGPSGLKLFNS